MTAEERGPARPVQGRLAIWGLGRDGRATLDHLRACEPGWTITVLDDGEVAPGSLPEGVAALAGAEAGAALVAGAFDLVVKSPGVSLYRPEVARARARGTRFTSSVNLWFAENPDARTIAVTGTKGKSTTARLLHHMLGALGLDAALLGNVGVPPLGRAPGRDWTVLELSSYQTADLDHGPDIALVTNLYPEHAPWHGGVERYYADKLRLLALDPRTTAFANGRDVQSRARLADRPDVRWFGVPPGYDVLEDALQLGDVEVDTSAFQLRGRHNLANLAGVLTILDHLGLDGGRALDALGTFRQLPHRLEAFAVGKVLCVDDSISTIPEATMAALDAFPDRDTLLLLGGTERGQSYDALYDRLRVSRVAAVALLPPNGARIHAEFAARDPRFALTFAEGLEEAIDALRPHARPGALVLLSPAAPSFGLFRDFEARGEAFKALCRARFA